MNIFVCGTDTSVGKTVATAALALAMPQQVTMVKPVQTGSPTDDDAAWVEKIAGCTSHVWERFSDPLAPAVAAERTGRHLNIDELARKTRNVQATTCLCEAAGGLLAPLSGDATMADLGLALAWPLVLVTRPDLGTLNHTALTIEVATGRGLNILGLMVSGFSGGLVQETNMERLERLLPVLGVIPHLEKPETQLEGATEWRHPEKLGITVL